MKTITISKNSRTKLLLLPLLLSALALGACSQQQVKDAGGAVSSSNTKNGGKGTTSTGASVGTIGSGGASNVTSNTNRGNGGARGNYLPNNQYNNNPNDTRDITLAGLKDPNNLLSQRVIYFDYNASSIRPEYMVLINTHAQLAAKYPTLRMRLEGHADERGSRAYNVALSEQRAQSVRVIMGTQGAKRSQIKTIGYGEEIPLVTGHTKKSWQKNRRVEIKYDNY